MACKQVCKTCITKLEAGAMVVQELVQFHGDQLPPYPVNPPRSYAELAEVLVRTVGHLRTPK